MAVNLRPLLKYHVYTKISSRSYYVKLKRTFTPPLQEPKESPYIVGPYLKPNYLSTEYITEPIKERNDDDFDHFIYEPTKIESDEERTVRLLLIQDVEGLGVAGQTVDANYRDGASKLVAMKKAEYATDFAHRWYKFGPKTSQSASSALSPRTSRMLKTQAFKLPISKDTIAQPWHIALALRLAGCICPIGAIDKESIVDFIDEQDRTSVKCIIRINNHEKVEVKFYHSSLVEKEEL